MKTLLRREREHMPGPSFSLVTLGCSKNQVDSEIMAGALLRQGYRPTGNVEAADIIIINTCGFIEAAREESIQAILKLAQHKKKGKCRVLVAAGCLVQRYIKGLRKVLPEVDIYISLDEVADIGAILGGKRVSGAGRKERPEYLYDGEVPRFIEEGAVSAYLKISEGCDNRCHYCAIPLIRGSLRSRSPESLLQEARYLMDKGIRELNVIAHDCTAYGRDLGLENGLVTLTERLLSLKEFHWIRLLYLFPDTVPENLLDLMKDEERLCAYLDIPIQHCNKEILRRMGRNDDIRPVVSFIEKARKKIPDITIRTTCIVGFPGEKERQFEELLSFCRDMQFERLGVFSYSPEEGTAAARLPEKIPESLKKERSRRLLRLQQGISEKKNKSLLGKEVEVLLEGYHPETDFLWKGRTAAQAPEVDGDVIINEGQGAFGEFVAAEITDTYAYDLIGRIIEKER